MKKKLFIPLLSLCLISMAACGENKKVSNDTGNIPTPSQIIEETLKNDEQTSNEEKSNEEKSNEQTSNEEKKNDTTSEVAESKEADESKKLVNGMRPEFKEAMDSYEAFYDEYCTIVKKYTANPSDIKLLADYTAMLTKAAEMTEKFDAWENGDMNSTELKYYLDVNNRITKKLAELSE